jgi:cytosol alanyl aminopeptidase
VNIRTTLPPLAFLLVACTPEPPPAMPPPVAPTATEAPPPAPEEPVPTLRLPTDVHPTAESVELRVDPGTDRFSGVVDISATLDRPRAVVWLHGKGLHVTRATVTPAGGAELAATYEQRHESGVASITAPQPVSGAVKIHVEYDAALNTSPEGLYKTSEGGIPYAFTQFESIAARTAFPCFDEPGLKIPWTEQLVVPHGAQAISNTHEIGRADEGAWTRVRFAETLPLPSYLTAFAVGPLDVVEVPAIPPSAVRTRAIPLRGVAPKGRGKEMAYALAHTGELLTRLEGYFGIAYPYDKLDILAVPDKGGAMENAGAITFMELLVLMDETKAPIRQLRGYASVMTHEVAHQWVGDLVTAAWWDDIWLNEAFASWIAAKVADAWSPKIEARMDLLGGVQGAMGQDGLVSARSIRQPIASTNDIENAFDSITYEKGGGVLAMFERWLGEETFQRGVHAYLTERAFKAGTADDFLGALSAAAGKDVKTPFHTFLDQPGVPFVEAEVRCDGAPRIHLKQSRYLPVGSDGDAGKTWQIPVCARAGIGKDVLEVCTLLTEKEGDLPLGDRCPAWVFPNADASGYFRFSLASADLAKLRKAGLASLSEREKVAYGNSLRAALNRGSIPFGELVLAAAPLVDDGHPSVVAEPMAYVGVGREWLQGDPLLRNVESYGQRLYRGLATKLGWAAKKGEADDQVELRGSVLGFMAMTAKDPGARAEAKKRGLAYLGYGKDGAIHPEAVDPNLLGVVLGVTGEEADPALWDAMRATFLKTTDDLARRRLLFGLGSARGATTSARARDFALDPALHTTEVLTPIAIQMHGEETREAAWRWVEEHYDAFIARVSQHHGRPQVFALPDGFCDEAHLAEVERFLSPRAPSIDGAPRVLASTLEHIRLCAAQRRAEEPAVRAFFAKQKK